MIFCDSVSSGASLSAKRKADRNSNLFEGLSAFSFCKDARGRARGGQRAKNKTPQHKC